MKSYIKKNIICFYIGLFLIISYLSIFYSSIYLSSKYLYYKQLIWYSFGLIVFFIVKRIKLQNLLKYSFYLYVFNLILLFGLFFFGSEINNSKSWYLIFGIGFQPSEFMKICIILLDTKIIKSYYKKKINEKKTLLSLLTIFLIPSILTFLEPDTGSIIGYFCITISFIYISDIKKERFKNIFILGPMLLFLFFIFYFFFQDTFVDIFGTSFFYRIDRLINWNQRNGMQLNNSLIVIGSSGLLGHNRIPIYYPELETDFIFTSFSSVYGIIGGITLIISVFLFDLYLLNLVKKENKKYKKCMIFAITMLFFYQHVQNIGMSIGVLPITGITLPLISYGGSSLLSYLIILSFLVNKEKV